MIFPSFRYDVRDRLTAAAIVVVLLSACTLFLPYLQATVRNNRVFSLGTVCLAIMAVIMLRYTLTGFILTAYVTVCLWLTPSESSGSALYQIVCYSGLFLAGCATYPRWAAHKRWVYDAVCVIALANVATQLVQVCGVSFPKGVIPNAQYGFLGLMGNVNETSALLAVCLPFFFRKGWAYFISVVIGGLLMARTTNGLVAAGAVSLIWSLARIDSKKGIVGFSAICVMLAGAVLFVDRFDRLDMTKQMQGRGLVYTATAQAAIVKPFGWGFGQYDFVIPLLTHTGYMVSHGGDDARMVIRYLFEQVADKDALDRAAVRRSGETDAEKIRGYLEDPVNNTSAMFIQAHNEYLEMWFATGYLGLLFGLAFLWRSIVRGFRKPDTIPAYGLIASALTALLFFSWQIVPVAVLTVLCLVLCNSKEEESYA